MKTQQFFSEKECKTSINLTLFHYQYLMYLTHTRFGGNLSLTIDYLIRRYLAYLYKISYAPTKRTLTATYQPRTKKYVIKKIRIQPTYWGKLQDLRFFLGYSMSFIIRIMLDWEIQQEQIPVEPIIFMPPFNASDEEIYARIQIGNNYSSYNRLNHANLEVYCEFLCPAT